MKKALQALRVFALALLLLGTWAPRSHAAQQPDDRHAVAELSRLRARLVSTGRHVTAVDLRGSQQADDALPHLSGLPNLEHLDLGRSKVSDAGLAALESLDSLTTLNLAGTEISDAALAHLKDLPALASLNLTGTDVTDAGLAHLKDLPALAALDLSETEIGDEGLAHLGAMQGLRMLSLRGTRCTNDGLAHLGRLVHLKALSLNGTAVSDAGLRHLVGLVGLEELDVGRTRVTELGCANLRTEVCQSAQRTTLLAYDPGARELFRSAGRAGLWLPWLRFAHLWYPPSSEFLFFYLVNGYDQGPQLAVKKETRKWVFNNENFDITGHLVINTPRVAVAFPFLHRVPPPHLAPPRAPLPYALHVAPAYVTQVSGPRAWAFGQHADFESPIGAYDSKGPLPFSQRSVRIGWYLWTRYSNGVGAIRLRVFPPERCHLLEFRLLPGVPTSEVSPSQSAYPGNHDRTKGNKPMQLRIDRKYLFNLGDQKECVVVGVDGVARLVPR